MGKKIERKKMEKRKRKDRKGIKFKQDKSARLIE